MIRLNEFSAFIISSRVQVRVQVRAQVEQSLLFVCDVAFKQYRAMVANDGSATGSNNE